MADSESCEVNDWCVCLHSLVSIFLGFGAVTKVLAERMQDKLRVWRNTKRFFANNHFRFNNLLHLYSLLLGLVKYSIQIQNLSRQDKGKTKLRCYGSVFWCQSENICGCEQSKVTWEEGSQGISDLKSNKTLRTGENSPAKSTGVTCAPFTLL